MLKPFTLSLGLVVALSLTGESKAGGLLHSDSGCSTCGMASPQGYVASPQSYVATADCGSPCGGGLMKKCLGGLNGMGNNFGSMCSNLKNKFKHEYTYEWVLKKKKVKKSHCAPACESPVYATSQTVASPQVAAAPQAAGYGSPQAGYGSYSTPQARAAGQAYAGAPVPAMAAAPVNGDEAPPAPEVAPAAPAPPTPATGPQSSLLFSSPSGN